MAPVRFILIAAAIACIGCTGQKGETPPVQEPSASAAVRQPLMFHWSEEFGREVVSPIGRTLPAQMSKPAGLDLPELPANRPLLFVRWPRVPKVNSSSWIVLAASRAGGPYDLLCTDTNFDGRLSDEMAIHSGAITPSSYVRYRAAETLAVWGPVKMAATAPADRSSARTGQPVSEPFHVMFTLEDRGPAAGQDRYWLNLQSCDWREGQVKIGQGTFVVTLRDFDVDGRFDDVTTEDSIGDYINMRPIANAQSVEEEGRFIGRFIEVEHQYYEFQVAPDGSWVSFRPAVRVPVGTIHVDKSVAGFSVFGPSGHFECHPVGGLAQVPVGRYRVRTYGLAATGSDGVGWTMWSWLPPAEKPFDVNAGHTVQSDLGGPLQLTIADRVRGGRRHHLMCHVLSAAGDPLVPLRQEQPRLPMLHIRNDDGSYDSRFPTSLESLRSSYGWDLQSIMWTEPTDRKGPFTATLETDAPFEFVSKPLVIKGNSGS